MTSLCATTGIIPTIKNGLRRWKDSITSKERTREDLKIGIAGFYDRSSKLWEEVWGELNIFSQAVSKEEQH